MIQRATPSPPARSFARITSSSAASSPWPCSARRRSERRRPARRERRSTAWRRRPRNQDLTLVAAYAASPPAVDEIAFTMETENLMALTYGGDLMQYKPIWYPDDKVCGAGVNLPGDEAVMGRWAESWKARRPTARPGPSA